MLQRNVTQSRMHRLYLPIFSASSKFWIAQPNKSLEDSIGFILEILVEVQVDAQEFPRIIVQTLGSVRDSLIW